MRVIRVYRLLCVMPPVLANMYCIARSNAKNMLCIKKINKICDIFVTHFAKSFPVINNTNTAHQHE